MPRMTAAEVYKAIGDLLEKYPETADKPLTTQGCDCWGDVGEVRYDPDEPMFGIELYRPPFEPDED